MPYHANGRIAFMPYIYIGRIFSSLLSYLFEFLAVLPLKYDNGEEKILPI